MVLLQSKEYYKEYKLQIYHMEFHKAQISLQGRNETLVAIEKEK